MIDSYFFVPGDKQKYLNKMKDIDADYFVIDLEESVSKSNKQNAYNNIINFDVKQNSFIRIPFFEDVYSKSQLLALINKFKGRIVTPKISSSRDIEFILSLSHKPITYKIIILVENPMCFLNIFDIINKHSDHIYAIGFGSHDFCTVMGMKHTLEHLNQYKKQLILVAKALNISYIDGVDLNIRELSDFEKECKYAFDSGADGKFIIHPDQLKKIKEIQFLSIKEIEGMKELLKKTSLISDNDVDLIEVDGKIYEKPHFKRIEKLINKLNRNDF